MWKVIPAQLTNLRHPTGIGTANLTWYVSFYSNRPSELKLGSNSTALRTCKDGTMFKTMFKRSDLASEDVEQNEQVKAMKKHGYSLGNAIDNLIVEQLLGYIF